MSVEVEKATQDRFTDRNFDFFEAHMLAILDDPTLLDEIPNGATVVWLPDDDPELAAYNRALGEQREREGKIVLYKRVPANAAADDER